MTAPERVPADAARADAQIRNVRRLILHATTHHGHECEHLRFLPESRYDRAAFPTVGQYDWVAGQVLYCLVRATRPRTIVEFSTSSGYSTMFMASAITRNGSGVLHTVDIDAAAQQAAARGLAQHGLSDVVRLHLGDCRSVVPRLLDDTIDLLFIDTLHSLDIARWYLREIVPRLHDDALVQVHDVMPPEARVRIHGGPPFEPAIAAASPTAAQLMKRAVWLALHGRFPNPFPRESPREMLPLDRLEVHHGAGELPCIDGNYFEEAVLLRELFRDADRDAVVYLHRMLGELEALSPQRYAAMDLIGRTDAHGAPMEWNDALWVRAATIRTLTDWRRVQQASARVRAAYLD